MRSTRVKSLTSAANLTSPMLTISRDQGQFLCVYVSHETMRLRSTVLKESFDRVHATSGERLRKCLNRSVP